MRHFSTLWTLLLLLYTCSLWAQDFAQLEQQYGQQLKEKKLAEAAQTAIQIADSYLQLPQGERNYKKVIDYYTQAISHAKSAGNTVLEAKALLRLGQHYGQFNETTAQSINYYNQSITILERNRDWNTYVQATSELSNVFAKQASTIGSAIGVLQRSQSAAKKHNIAIDEEDYYRRFVVLYRKKGDEKNANIYLSRLKRGGNSRPTVSSSTSTDNLTPSAISFELEEAREREEALNEQIRRLKANSRQESKENQQQIQLLEEQRLLLEEKKTSLEREKAVLEREKQAQEKLNYALYGITGLAVLVLVIGLFAYIGQQRANKRLTAKNAEILYQKQEIEEQKHEIEEQSEKLKVEQEKSEKLLLNILPKATAEELKEYGFASPKSYEMVTVLFTDFKGFTKIAEQLTPEKIVLELDYCFLKFDDIVERHNMEKIKTIGDAYMCAGGIPIENTTNPFDAVRAGLEMQEFMLQRKEEKLSKGETPFELRVGIHTGPVVAGVVGKRKFAYDIWGDAVNIAARMESSSEVGRVNISETTYEYIKHEFYCNYRGKIKAKNKGEIDMYFVNGPIV